MGHKYKLRPIRQPHKGLGFVSLMISPPQKLLCPIKIYLKREVEVKGFRGKFSRADTTNRIRVAVKILKVLIRLCCLAVLVSSVVGDISSLVPVEVEEIRR